MFADYSISLAHIHYKACFLGRKMITISEVVYPCKTVNNQNRRSLPFSLPAEVKKKKKKKKIEQKRWRKNCYTKMSVFTNIACMFAQAGNTSVTYLLNFPRGTRYILGWGGAARPLIP